MSDKPVIERLQVKNGRRLAVLAATPNLGHAIGGPDLRAAPETADVLLLFVRNRADFDRDVPGVLNDSRPDAILWIAYPKLTSSLAGDLNRDIIHALAPSFGIDCVSQIAIDADWSALRFKRL